MAYLSSREKAAKSVSVRMRTEGVLPGGMTVRTSGSLRVLGETHLHTTLRAEFGDEMTSETETVRNEQGIWMRQKDPVQGEVFLHMPPDLVARLESAGEVLGGGADPTGALGGPADGPLGSVMLEDLDTTFALEVDGPRGIDGVECWVVSGPLRGGTAPAGSGGPDLAMPMADHVEILVRRLDAAVIRMTQLRQGKPMLTVHIDELLLDQPAPAESFVLDVPPRAKVVDALAHEPTAAQVERLFEEARAKGWKDPGGPASPDAPQDGDGRGR